MLQMLLGARELIRNRWICDCDDPENPLIYFHGVQVKLMENVEFQEFAFRFKENLQKFVNCNFQVSDSKFISVSRATDPDNTSEFSNMPNNTKKLNWLVKPDAEYTFWSEIEKLKVKLKNTDTVLDCEVNPKNELKTLNRRCDYDIHEQAWDLRKKFKHPLFDGDTGCINDDRYIVRGKIEGKLSSTKAVNYINEMPEDVKSASISQMNNEIANGVLVRLPRDMQPKNIISCFAIGKKDGKSGEIVLNTQSCRIVVDCSKTVN